MVDSIFNNSAPQFGTATYTTPETQRCEFCQQPLTGNFYRVNGKTACQSCAGQAQDLAPNDSHSKFVRALLLGGIAALIGMALYATFEIVTSITIGYAALGVGWIVGKGILMGSGGTGGRRYQIAAILLTYAAVSSAAVPVAIYELRSHPRAQHSASQNQQSSDSGTPDAGTSDSSSTSEPAGKPRMSGIEWLGRVLFFGLASPFYELFESPFGGLIGLVILYVGMKIAWRMTAGRPVKVEGPFSAAPAAG